MINPKSTKSSLDNLDLTSEHNFPKFLKSIKLNPFRHIPDLTIDFIHPVSVISGTNKSGKSTILMALACSHTNFQKRNPKNGKLERQTWSSLMKFTVHDKQSENWTYYITHKTGKKNETKRGQRKKSTKKWNGIGKKESQIKDRQVVFIDLDRIVPARFFNQRILNLANSGTLTDISRKKVGEIQDYLSYILEIEIKLKKLAEYHDKDIFKYDSSNEYTSFNTASGEDVLTRIIIDAVDADNNALILIDEIELGLHPKVQSRLIDILEHIALKEQKQFIFTTHSPTILSCLSDKSRIFIEKKHDETFRAIPKISVNAAYTKMDSKAHPLVDLYCEDLESKKIIMKGLEAIEQERALNKFSQLFNIIISGSAEKTFDNFVAHKRTYNDKIVRCGFACILDGDMKNIKDSKGNLTYPPQEFLHFLYSNEAPEYFLIKSYLQKNQNKTIHYHLYNSNPHCLFDKVIENSDFTSRDDLFNKCWDYFSKSGDGKTYIKTLTDFLLNTAKHFSPEL